MRGINLAEVGHIVSAVAPVDFTGGADGAWIHMSRHSHITFLVLQGVAAAAGTAILVEAATNAAGDNAEALPFACYSQETTDADVLSAREDVAATGKVPTANNNTFYALELNAEELPVGKPWVRARFTNGVNSVIGAIVGILSGARYGGPESPTVLS